MSTGILVFVISLIGLRLKITLHLKEWDWSSHDSNEELQALEYSEGPIQATRFGRGGRSFSISGFDFQHALLPLAASMSDPEAVTDVASEKSIGLVNGKPLL